MKKLVIAGLVLCLAPFFPALADKNSDAMPDAIPVPQAKPATRLEAATQGEIVFDSRSPFDFDILLKHLEELPVTSTMGYLYLPESATPENPVPAMVLLPGSGGVQLGRQMLYADLLVSHGYAVLVVDYYASRNVDDEKVPYAIMVSNVTEFDVLADAYGALEALNQHPAVDADRIGVMGFSYGGMVTRLALDARIKALLAPDVPPFAAHVDFYGPCFQDFGTQKTTGAPLLTLRGAQDATNDLVACAVDEERLRAAGSEVGSRIYASAGHSWGNLGPREQTGSTYVRGCEMVFDRDGLPSVRGVRMIDATDPVDRAHRYRKRLQSGQFFEGCLKSGYTVGRNEAVYQATNRDLLEFLEANL